MVHPIFTQDNFFFLFPRRNLDPFFETSDFRSMMEIEKNYILQFKNTWGSNEVEWELRSFNFLLEF